MIYGSDLDHISGLLSFMLERSPTLGSIETSDWEKKQFACRSDSRRDESLNLLSAECRPENFNVFSRTSLQIFLCRSLEFNLKNRVFCELFPELKLECERELERRSSQGPASQQESEVMDSEKIIQYLYNNNVKGERAPLDSQAANYGVFGNVLVIGGFAAFAFVVRYVLQSMANIE